MSLCLLLSLFPFCFIFVLLYFLPLFTSFPLPPLSASFFPSFFPSFFLSNFSPLPTAFLPPHHPSFHIFVFLIFSVSFLLPITFSFPPYLLPVSSCPPASRCLISSLQPSFPCHITVPVSIRVDNIIHLLFFLSTVLILSLVSLLGWSTSTPGW